MASSFGAPHPRTEPISVGETSDVNRATSVKAKATNPRPMPQPHVAAALPVPDNAHRMNQQLRSSQVLAASLTIVNSH